ncbi:ExbD/TolR family protein [Chlamydiota bacterium]
MRRISKRNRKEVVADINITNLVDVTMVLLIVFILIAPMIEQGIDIKLPTAEPTKLDVDENTVVLSVTKYGFVYLNDNKISIDDLKPRLKSIKDARPKVGVMLRGDEDVEYGQIIRVLDIVRNLGITDLDIATRSEK